MPHPMTFAMDPMTWDRLNTIYNRFQALIHSGIHNRLVKKKKKRKIIKSGAVALTLDTNFILCTYMIYSSLIINDI